MIIIFKLTSKESEIMELLWSQDQALSRSDIIDMSENNRTWKASSIHILLNSLIRKGYIEVDGFVKTGKNYGRTFRPVVSEEEYMVQQLKTPSISIPKFFSALVKDEDIGSDVLEELKNILEQK